MSAVTHVGTVIVPVADQDAALAFYTGTLGFEVRLDGEFAPGQRWLEVAPPGAEHDARARPRRRHRGEPRHRRRRRRPRGAGGAGADVDAEVMRWGGGMPPMFTFRDPDGNPFRVVER